MKIANKIIEMARGVSRPSRTQKRHRTVDGTTNRKMDDETYKLRRIVIDAIYKLKKVDPGLPRIQVRITKGDKKFGNMQDAEGVAYVSADAIFIMDNAIENYDEVTLFSIIAHEVIHASYGVRHVKDKKDIMYPYVQKYSDEKKVLKEFKKWGDRYLAGQIKTDGWIDKKGKHTPWYIV